MSARTWLLSVSLLVVGCVCVCAHADDGEALVSHADEAFRRAVAVVEPTPRRTAFADAAARYSEAVTARPGNGALEYDCGNAYLLAGDVGRAVLHLRRAARALPGDERVATNLAIARTQRRDRVEVSSTRSVLETVAFWHRGLSLPTKLPLGALLWLLGVGGLAIAAARGRAATGGRPLRRVGVACALAAVALGVSAWIDVRDLDDPASAVLIAEEAPLRSGDGASYPSRYEQPVHAGAEVQVISERGGWNEIELSDGKSGWVPSSAVERVVQSVSSR